MITNLAQYSGTNLSGMSWFTDFLDNYMGPDAATAVVSTIAVVVNLLIVYIVIMQFFKIMKGIENKNSADGGERAQAMTQIKNAIIVVVLVVVVGAVGFNALLFLGGSVTPPPDPGT